MSKSKLGPIVTVVILAAGAGFLYLNRETGDASKGSPGSSSGLGGDGVGTPSPAPAPGVADSRPAMGGERPIGDDVVKNHMEIAAVWLPSIGMAGMAEPSADVVHIEADIHATEKNPNGFAKDEFVPYLKVHYNLVESASGKLVTSGELVPMVARDGLHYGANIARPAPGTYKLVYQIQPPSAGGLGRHSDKTTGVAPWWEPFSTEHEWVMEPAAPK